VHLRSLPALHGKRAFSKILHEYGATVSVDRVQLDGLLATAGKESLDLAHGLGLPVLVADAKAEEADAAFDTAAAEAIAEGIPPDAVLNDAADLELVTGKGAQASGTATDALAVPVGEHRTPFCWQAFRKQLEPW